MLTINIHTEAVMKRLEGMQTRLQNRAVFFQHVIRPRLIDEFAAAYRAAGINIRTGRLLESFISLTHAEHVSEVSRDRIIEGSRVPYAIFVERLLPIAGRVRRNQGLINEFAEQLGVFIVDGHQRTNP